MDEIYNSFNFNKNITTLHIHESCYANISTRWMWKIKNPPFSRLYYMEDGETEIIADGKSLLLKSGFAYLLPTDVSLENVCKKHMEQLYFHISMFDFANFDILSLCKICDGIPTDDIPELISLYQSKNIIDILKLKERINYDCIRFLEKSGCALSNKSYSDAVQKGIAYITQNLSASLKVSDICKNIFISKGTLNTAFRAELGKSVGEYIDDTVMEKSKILLSTNSALISEISDSLGFCDQFYFSRKFKEKYGETPSEYRKNNFTTGLQGFMRSEK